MVINLLINKTLFIELFSLKMRKVFVPLPFSSIKIVSNEQQWKKKVSNLNVFFNSIVIIRINLQQANLHMQRRVALVARGITEREYFIIFNSFCPLKMHKRLKRMQFSDSIEVKSDFLSYFWFFLSTLNSQNAAFYLYIIVDWMHNFNFFCADANRQTKAR